MHPVVHAKIAVPVLPDGFVPRPRLLAALDGTDRRTVLVCAPAGFGKTALLAHWARTPEPRTDVAWAALERQDDPGRFWSVVLAAVRDCPTVPAGNELHDLDPTDGSHSPAFVAAVRDALDALPVRIALVLHDVHHVVAPGAVEGLTELVAAPPAGMHLILCSRLDPLLSLGAVRSAGNLREIRVDQLRYSPEETAAALRGSGVCLTRAQVRAAHACTGGWPAGVRLVAAALRTGGDPDTFLERFAADSRPVGDFLVGEVLAALPAADRAALATVGVGEEADPEVLDRIARETGLVAKMSEPGAGFRVDALVQAHLQAEFRPRSTPAGTGDRTALRSSAEDDPVGAMDDAMRAADVPLLVELVHRFTGLLLVTGQHSLLGRALAHLGEHTIGQDPWLILCSALTRIESGNPAGAAADVARAARLHPAEPDPRWTILRSVTELCAAASTADLAAVPGRVDLARARLDSPEWAALAMVSTAGRALLVDAEPARARVRLQEAIALARQCDFRYLEMQGLAVLGAVEGITGHYPAMATAASAAVRAAATAGWGRSPWPVAGRWMLAYGALLRAQPAEACRYASEAFRLGGTALQPRFAYALQAVHGAALFDSGQRHLGLEQMRQARADLGAVSLSDEQAAALAVLEHRAAVDLGREDAARAVVTWFGERAGARGEVLLMRAWAELAAGRTPAARADVEPVLDGTAVSVLPHTIVEALLVEAAGGVTGGDVRTARHALAAALTSGATLGVVRPFATAGAQARQLLDDHVNRSGTAGSFVTRALAAGSQPTLRTARLDGAEERVLERLASSLSVEQIAGELEIPVMEARARMRMVYLKLGASSRRSAVTAAHERGLLR